MILVKKKLLAAGFLMLTAAAAVCAAAADAGGRQTFGVDQMAVRFWRGGARTDAPDAPARKVARVGREWSVEWLMKPLKPRTLDYGQLYDVYVRCLGDFSLGMYGAEGSGGQARNGNGRTYRLRQPGVSGIG